MSELGWIKKDPIKGWHLTELGKRLGGLQSIYKTSGVPYVRWPQTILKNSILITSTRQASGDTSNIIQDQSQNTEVSDLTEFRDKFRPELRATDGHYVRSKAELIIDNWLYFAKIVHAYERKLPIEEEIYCDFYIPTGKVYIEYWGSEEAKYLARKAKKLEIYKKYNLNLIQLFEKEISNLEDKLPAKLLGFGIPIE
jgi:predicted nuclease of restriction endonuclease-like RecB superfamily